jgi:small GTP-binding protein
VSCLHLHGKALLTTL